MWGGRASVLTGRENWLHLWATERGNDMQKIYAHRGASGYAPENTLRAFALAAFPALEEKTLEAVEKAGMREKTIYSSFNHYSLLKVHRLDPNAVCGLLYDAMLYQPWDYARQLGVQALHPHFSEPTFVTGEVEAAHRLGLSVNVWTVNEEADLRRMAEMDCDGIISNYPDVALRVLREVRG